VISGPSVRRLKLKNHRHKVGGLKQQRVSHL
jgi:hypothetical protein